MTKSEESTSELLKQAACAERTAELTQQLQRVGTTFFNHREVSAQEAVDRLLSSHEKNY